MKVHAKNILQFCTVLEQNRAVKAILQKSTEKNICPDREERCIVQIEVLCTKIKGEKGSCTTSSTKKKLTGTYTLTGDLFMNVIF